MFPEQVTCVPRCNEEVAAGCRGFFLVLAFDDDDVEPAAMRRSRGSL
jgi:hypothetical protein